MKNGTNDDIENQRKNIRTLHLLFEPAQDFGHCFYRLLLWHGYHADLPHLLGLGTLCIHSFARNICLSEGVRLYIVSHRNLKLPP